MCDARFYMFILNSKHPFQPHPPYFFFVTESKSHEVEQIHLGTRGCRRRKPAVPSGSRECDLECHDLQRLLLERVPIPKLGSE